MTILDTTDTTGTGAADAEARPGSSSVPPAAAGGGEGAAPVVDVPLSEASQDLTGYEVTAIERHWAAGIEDLSGTKMLMGCIWAYEGRREGKAVSWARVNEMTYRQMSAYFKEEPKPKSEGAEGAEEDSGKG